MAMRMLKIGLLIVLAISVNPLDPASPLAAETNELVVAAPIRNEADEAAKMAAALNEKFEVTDLSANELGEQFAKSDVDSGRVRLLIYGEVTQDMTRDDETGLSLTIVAGCKVTQPLVDFVKSYNAVMRKEFEVAQAKQRVEDEKVIGFVRPVVGKVLEILEQEAQQDLEIQMVKLNLGSNQGIAIEDRVAICRDGGYEFGILIVTKVEKNTAQAKVVYVQESDLLAVGDVVLKDTSLAISSELVTQSKPDPSALAQRHAESDFELGVQRIFYYGKGSGNSIARFDESSGLRMQMNGGCIVSKESQEFTETYNSLMRKLAKTKMIKALK